MLTGYLALFALAFLAATFLPLSSEILLVALLQGPHDATALVLVATLGNVLGSCVNWWLGIYLLRFQERRWFYFSAAQIARAQQWFHRYGQWSLLLAWVPVIGDPLTLLAGVMRVRFPVFLALVTLGKLLRYAFIAWMTLSYAGASGS
jgi:membrane protein YqaA with SNARE-associated domain